MKLFRPQQVADFHEVFVEIGTLSNLSSQINNLGIQWKYQSNKKSLCRGQIHLSTDQIAPNLQISNVVSDTIIERHFVHWANGNNNNWNLDINKLISFTVPLVQKGNDKYKSKQLEITFLVKVCSKL
jgi:hypothetical protein